MSEYEYQETLNARAAQNRETEEKRVKMLEEVDQANRQVKQSKYIRKANRAMLKRALAAIFLIAAMVLAQVYDLINAYLSGGVIFAVMVWIAVWIGAWVQLRFAKGGLLEC